MKRCSKCEIEKALTEFHKRVASPDGLAYKCKVCVNHNSSVWRADNPGAHIEWYSKNKNHKAIYFKGWREKNKDREPLRISLWSKKNPHKINANTARRTAAKLRAVPRWADAEAIEKIYAEAARLRRETGERYEVDHIVPLQGRTVSGFHCEYNLQILQKAANISKHNRFWPDMP